MLAPTTARRWFCRTRSRLYCLYVRRKRGLRGRRRKQKQAKQQQVVDQARQASEEIQREREEFKKAFSACLEARGYTVK